jgi:hypothetical protein
LHPAGWEDFRRREKADFRSFRLAWAPMIIAACGVEKAGVCRLGYGRARHEAVPI